MKVPWYEKYITKTPGVQGGEPCVKGTRTPVRSIVGYFCQIYPGDLTQVQRALPHLNCKELEAALAYYDAHRDEIDGHIRSQAEALQRFLSTP
jgi:uncharacterized protein (DUF433 family)